MAKANQGQTLVEGLAAVNIYKRNQGRLTRQLTALAIAAIFVLGAWSLGGPLSGYDEGIKYGVPVGISIVGCWLAFRAVNYPRFADFLISVQAEMDKVSWASREELKRSTIVVIVTMFFLATALFTYDLFWIWLFRTLTILQPEQAGDLPEAGV